MEHHDPKGKVHCDDCDDIGRPKGGVTVSCVGDAVTIKFERPKGWAVTHDGALLCNTCGRKAALPKKRKRRTFEDLGEAVVESTYGDSSLVPRNALSVQGRKGIPS